MTLFTFLVTNHILCDCLKELFLFVCFSADLWLGLQLQWTARFGKQWKPTDAVQDRCTPRCQRHPGQSLEKDGFCRALC